MVDAQEIEGKVFRLADRVAVTEPTIKFQGKDGLEIMRLEPNGDIFVRDKKVENDNQVVDGLRAFLKDQGY